MDTYKWIILLFLLIAMLTFVVTVIYFRTEQKIETIRYIEHATDSIIGDVKHSTHVADFHGWLICDGRSVSRDTYHELFRVIGTTFGSTDLNSFNLPDARGRVIGLSGHGTGLTLRRMGDRVGEEVHTLSAQELTTHRHIGTIQVNGQHHHTGTVDSAGLHQHAGTVDSAGSHAHSVVDPGHSHSQNTINDDFNSSGGSGPSFAADSSGSRTWNNINGSATGISIDANGSHAHTFTSLDNGAHTHTFTSEDNGAHTHAMSISDTGSSVPFNVMQPTLFIGNLFIFAGVEFSHYHDQPTPTPTSTPTLAPGLPQSSPVVSLLSLAPNQGIAIHSSILP